LFYFFVFIFEIFFFFFIFVQRLGFGEPFFISVSHAIGIVDILDSCVEKVPFFKLEEEAPELNRTSKKSFQFYLFYFHFYIFIFIFYYFIIASKSLRDEDAILKSKSIKISVVGSPNVILNL
jgi:predicted GTPase